MIGPEILVAVAVLYGAVVFGHPDLARPELLWVSFGLAAAALLAHELWPVM